MQEAHHCVPQPAVGQALLVPNARTLQTAAQAPSDSPPLGIWILARRWVTCMYSVRELKTCLATARALEKFL